LLFRFDSYLYFSFLFQTPLLAICILQTVFDSDFAVKVVPAFDRNLRLFGSPPTAGTIF